MLCPLVMNLYTCQKQPEDGAFPVTPRMPLRRLVGEQKRHVRTRSRFCFGLGGGASQSRTNNNDDFTTYLYSEEDDDDDEVPLLLDSSGRGYDSDNWSWTASWPEVETQQ
jgi:hypothetical protein